MTHQGEAWPVASGEFTMAQQKDQRNYEYLSVKKDWILIYNMFNMLSSIKRMLCSYLYIYIYHYRSVYILQLDQLIPPRSWHGHRLVHQDGSWVLRMNHLANADLGLSFIFGFLLRTKMVDLRDLPSGKLT